MVSKFDDELPLVPQSTEFEDGVVDVRLGPCAMGPVADDEELATVQVVVLQTGEGRRAFATGRSGELVRAGAERPPFAERWRVVTRLEKGSDDFVPGRPALATAIAVAKRPNGAIEIERWSQTVRIAG